LTEQYGYKAVMTLASSGTITLQDNDAGKVFLLTNTVAQTITLPLAATMGAGNQMCFLQTANAGATATLATQGSDQISSTTTYQGTTYATSTSRMGRTVVICDGVSQWYVISAGP
jgi:hypothetical protein